MDIETRVLAEGLRFPEGPVAMPDGSVLVVEIAAGRLTSIDPDGSTSTVAETGGGPNGAAIGPDGDCYICNNGGMAWLERDGRLFPMGAAEDHRDGSIQKVDIRTGEVKTLYTECDGRPFSAPNDLVFDRAGGFWFTDNGRTSGRQRDVTGVFYAASDGSEVREVIFPMVSPNGIGLAPDESCLYVAETATGRLWAFDLAGPGKLAGGKTVTRGERGRLVVGLPGYQLFDSLAVEACGNVCVATLVNGGITIVAPDGGATEHVPFPDPGTTNICFGGPDMRTAFVTLSTTGQVVARRWPRPGHRLNCA